jgi:hypothetical protein
MKLSDETTATYEESGACRDANPEPDCTIHYSEHDEMVQHLRKDQALKYIALERRKRELSPLQRSCRRMLWYILVAAVLGLPYALGFYQWWFGTGRAR